jgi:phospholipase C
LPNLQVGPDVRYVHSYRGTVHVVPVPDSVQLAAYTRAVAENNHLPLHSTAAQRDADPVRERATPVSVPERAGEPSLIEHVIYIVKENRTYDQILGDLKRGNGDRTLSIYGEDVTPNHHKLGREFVTLDNFYATGGNSGDGHQWVTQAAETDYAYWPGYDERSYPFDGNDPIAYANGGFLWDAALKVGKTLPTR